METSVVEEVYSTVTWRMLEASALTKLGNWDNATAANLYVTDFDFVGTSVTSPALTATAEEVDASNDSGNFVSFEVANCTLGSISMDCINWVITSTAEETTEFSDIGGYKKWAEGDSVKFWWWDGRDLD